MPKVIFVHPSSSVSSNARIGEGTKIWQFCTVLEGAKIGRDVLLSQNVYVEGGVKIGNRVKIKNNVALFDGVTLGDDVFIAPNAVFTNVINPRSFISRKKEFLPTLVKEGATVGANATVLCGVTVGKFAFIGAGAVVTKNVRDYALVLGVPAVQAGWICRCGVALKGEGNVKCKSCKKTYQLTRDRCRKAWAER